MNRRWLKRIAVPLLLLFSWSPLGGVSYVGATHTDNGPDGIPATGDERPLPHAAVRIWSPASEPATSYSVNTGFIANDPNQTIADTGGLTSHVNTATNPLTIVTVYENTGCSSAPCGVTYMNPANNDFKCYGYSGGFMSGISLHTTAPTRTSGDGTKTFQPGDTWLFKSSGRAVAVQFKGSDNFRFWGDSQGISTFGGVVDQATGNVWFAEPAFGRVNLLDPTTNVARRWVIGGNPTYIALDSSGRAYVTTGTAQQIVRVDPGLVTLNVTRWSVPGGGLIPGGGPSFFGNADGITVDNDGRVWFSEHSGNQAGRLDPATDDICEYTKTGISQPQNIASSGSGATLQSFFTEAAGNSVSVVTQVEADLMGSPNRVCTPSLVGASTVTETSVTLSVGDDVRLPSRLTSLPATFDVPGLDGVPASGATKTAGPDGIAGNADDEVIPGILRFAPLPAPSNNATGMTQVVAANTVYGSFIGSEQWFEVKSNAIIAKPEEPEPETCTPRTQGFWKRICEKDHPEFSGTDRTDLIAAVDASLGPDACAVYAQTKNPPKCLLAKRQRVALEFNLQSGLLGLACPLSSAEFSTVGAAVTEIDADILAGTDAQCKEANDLADAINTASIVVASRTPSLSAPVMVASGKGRTPVMMAKTTPQHPSKALRSDLLALMRIAQAIAEGDPPATIVGPDSTSGPSSFSCGGS